MSEYMISQITEKRIDDTAGMLAEEVVSAIKKGLPATALIKKLFELLDEAELMVRAEYTPLDAEGRTIAPFLTAMGFRQEKLSEAS
ncbi:MAG: hypothetical protein IJR19_10085 [Lachnospiraceae bacterium]|nr:hypothetical protein [Lachnospiraceae bacterium]